MRKLYTKLSLFAAALCMSAATWAVDIVDGVYQIGTADDLEAFAAAVEQDPTINGVLTADIDMTAEKYINFAIAVENPYAGTFDGQYHTVTIEIESSASGYGALWRKVGDCTIRNVNVAGHIHAVGKFCSGFAGSVHSETCLIENCVSTVDIETEVQGDGSHSGFLGQVPSASIVTINNCAFAGKIRGLSTNQCGGMIGWSDGKTYLNNVMVIGEFDINGSSDGTWGNLTFGRNPGNITINGAVYLNPLDNVEKGAVQVTEDQLADGTACFLANMAAAAPVWFQNIGTDPTPVPNPAHAIVYRNGRAHCDGTAYEEEVSYSNTNTGSVVDEHDYVDGICSYCHVADPNYAMEADENGFYTITNAAQLVWFASKVNGGENTINGRITEDIDLDGTSFTPIGDTSHPYGGIFEGNFKVITNANQMIFGTVNSATISGINVQGGTVSGGKDYAAHTGSIIGYLQKGTLTHSYSSATIAKATGDCGGLIGKIGNGCVIKDVMFAGNLTSGWSAGCVAGSTNGANQNVQINDVFVDARNVTYSNGDAHALVVGWLHDGLAPNIQNVWIIAAPTLTNIMGHTDNAAVAAANCTLISEGEASLGTATWALNHNSFIGATWFQTLEEDAVPTLDNTHGTVFATFGGTLTNDLEEFKSALIEDGKASIEDMFAYQPDIDAFDKALDAVAAATDMDAFLEAYQTLSAVSDTLTNSLNAYDAYQEEIDQMNAYIEANDFPGQAYENLCNYVGEDVEPGELFPNGSYSYIKENKQLTAEQMTEELAFAKSILEAAMKANYEKGTDITSLIINADLSAATRFEGWTTTKNGSTLTTGTEEGVGTAAETWNATADVHQTLSGLKNGVYELRANAVTRPGSNTFNANDNYIAYLYANDSENYVMALTEDMVAAKDTLPMVNCDPSRDDMFEIDGVEYYVPCTPGTAAIAFAAGRYQNSVVAEVTDNTLTIGIRIPGTGQSLDWMAFGNFRLYYLGEAGEAEISEEAKASYSNRVATLVKYQGSTQMPDSETDNGINYQTMPNFPVALREQAQQQVEAGDYKALTATYHAIDEAKKAYIELIDFANLMQDNVYRDEESTEEEITEMVTVVDNIFVGCEEGTITTEQAIDLAGLKETAFYKRFFTGAPMYKAGYYQLATAADVIWFAKVVNNLGLTTTNAELLAPVDFTELEYISIGTVASPYAGTFKGNMHAITNANKMIFGTTKAATISGINVQGGVVNGAADYAAHTGAIIGYMITGTLTQSYSNASVQSPSTGDCGGLIGKIGNTCTISDVMFAGNLTCGWSAGCLAGSTNGNNQNVYISNVFIDARNVTYKNGDAHALLIGWYHDGNQKKLSNAWVIAGPELTNLAGYNDDKAAVAAKTHVITAEEAATGVATWGLNNGEETAPVWFQTLGKDETPTLNPTSLIVYKEGESYINKSDLNGDVNGDNEIDVADIECVLDAIANKEASKYAATADVNGDNEIDVADIECVLSIIANK